MIKKFLDEKKSLKMLHSPLFLSLTASLLLPLNYLYNTLIINKLNYCMYLYIYYQIELFNRLDYFVSALHINVLHL